MAEIGYELVLLGPEKNAHKSELEVEVSKLFAGIGLDFGADGGLLIGGAPQPDWGGFPVALWFGGVGAVDPSELALASEFLGRGFNIFPVVANLKHYTTLVPTELTGINGQQWDAGIVGANVMAGFRLA